MAVIPSPIPTPSPSRLASVGHRRGRRSSWRTTTSGLDRVPPVVDARRPRPRDVAVLDGGIEAWQAAGQPLTTGLTAEARWRRFGAPRIDGRDMIERDDLRERLGIVASGRSRGPRYRGEVEPVDPYPGHIPTAINPRHRPEPRARRPLPRADRLRARPAPAVRPGRGRHVVRRPARRPRITSSPHGSPACREPILYVGSYSDWSRSGNPVVIGTEPGRPEDAVGT